VHIKIKNQIIILLLLVSFQSFSQITEIGLASFYSDKYDGKITASGEVFDQSKLTAAHRTFPFGTRVKVINIKNKRSVEVIINDRGPFVKERVIDLSKSAADILGFVSKGTAMVKVEVVSLGKINNIDNKQKAPNKITQNKKDIIVNTIEQNKIEYYKISSQKIAPSGFGIQIASYKDGANLLKRYDSIKKGVDKDVIVKISKDEKGDDIYRIIIGIFPTKDSAIKYNKSLDNRFTGSFIVVF